MNHHRLLSLRPCNFFSLSLCCFFLMMINILMTSSVAAPKPNELVSSICRNTSNYKFCVESLYSDPRTPTADRYVVAYISFELAYTNATHTKGYLHNLFLSNTTAGGDSELLQRLRQCERYYEEAVSALAYALNDLNSETFSELAYLAGAAGGKAHECEATLQGRGSSALSRMNRDLRALSKICVVVSYLFTG